jgi:hypothetical protein
LGYGSHPHRLLTLSLHQEMIFVTIPIVRDVQ